MACYLHGGQASFLPLYVRTTIKKAEWEIATRQIKISNKFLAAHGYEASPEYTVMLVT